jgi:hypothetical protein
LAAYSGILPGDFYLSNNTWLILAKLKVAICAYDCELLSLRHE